MKRGAVYDIDFDPAQGSEQGGVRPGIIVSNDLINISSEVVIVVPCTTYKLGRKLYRSQVLINAIDGVLDKDSVALGEQLRAISKSRLSRYRGMLSEMVIAQLNMALSITIDLINS